MYRILPWFRDGGYCRCFFALQGRRRHRRNMVPVALQWQSIVEIGKPVWHKTTIGSMPAYCLLLATAEPSLGQRFRLGGQGGGSQACFGAVSCLLASKHAPFPFSCLIVSLLHSLALMSSNRITYTLTSLLQAPLMRLADAGPAPVCADRSE